MTENNTNKKKSKRWIIFVVIALIIAAAVFFLPRMLAKKVSDAMTDIYSYDTVTKRDITETLSGSGTLKPANSYTVISLVSGEILHADFLTGDKVSKDDILYEVDSSDTSNGIERAEIALSQTRRNYDKKIESQSDLTVKAPISGYVSGITAVSGSKVSMTMPAASISDTDTLYLTEYYSDEYAGLIQAGQSAEISVADRMLSVTGSVREVSGLKKISETGVSCFAVTLQLSNPGALQAGEEASAVIHTAGGDVYPSISSSKGLEASAQTTVYYDISGTVASVYVREGEYVKKGQTIMVLSSDTLSDEIKAAADALRDAELSVDKQYDMLDSYSIKAPIDGTIVDKYYKEGENAETGKVLCTIFDLSYLNITLNIDELDITKVAVGQQAIVTADAVPDREFKAEITEMSINGTSVNGVTTYPVTVKISSPEGLLPGMNVDVNIIISENKGVLSIPTDAVNKGDLVLVKTADGHTGEGAPEGYEFKEVETGASNEDFVQILSGLSEGESIAYIPSAAAGTGLFWTIQKNMGPGMGPGMGGF